jgi:4-hydroxy-3-methylbut-2-enyl diphosphate reductase
MNINIDESAGFCWGVVRTIDIAEKILSENKNVYILGQIIHNPKESERLESLGLKTITVEEFKNIANSEAIVIIRAHGEPPATYKKAKKYNITIIDATCPLVRALQKRVKKYYDLGYQILIFGKKEHAEVIGLRGVCNDECIVINSIDAALNYINFSRKT